MNTSDKDMNLLQKIKDNWLIIVFFVSLIIWYTNVGARLNAVEAKVLEQETTVQKIDQIQVDLAVVKNSVEFIKKQVE